MSLDVPNRKKLTQTQIHCLIEKGTEPPFSGKHLNENRAGTYTCVGCDTALFKSKDKYDAGCGWPSFTQSIPDKVLYVDDFSLGMHRIEVICATCKGHLGHVFPDGPAPTGQRYCINSVILDFQLEV